MSLRSISILVALAVALAAGAQQASAQGGQAGQGAQGPLEKPGRKDLIEPPATPPKLRRGDRTHNLEFLFGALKVAPDETSAKSIEERILALLLASGSDTCNLLMVRAKTAVDAENYDLAIHLLDSIIEIKPTYVEAWNRRATVFFLKRDYSSALSDIQQVLKREPRHFGALAGLGAIMQDIGDEKDALTAYRRALEIDPHLKGVSDKVKALTEKVEGRDL